MRSILPKYLSIAFLASCGIVLSAICLSSETSVAFKKLEKITEELNRFHDSDVATAEGYVHYDGYDTFSMGEHWYNKEVIGAGTCDGSKPSHLQYLVINGKRTLIGTGYVCKLHNNRIFDDSIEWHKHGPAWCRLPNGSSEDYRDLADAMPNNLTKLNWETICLQEGGIPDLKDIKMLHTWNWISSPNGQFAHENFVIPFLRVGLPVPESSFLESPVGKAVIRVLRLAHGDTQWWYWRGFNVINASYTQRNKGWKVLQNAKVSSQTIQKEMVTIGNLDDSEIAALAKQGDTVHDAMHKQLANVFSKEQMMVLDKYIASIQVHKHHEHEH